jgi:hypothetical protein
MLQELYSLQECNMHGLCLGVKEDAGKEAAKTKKRMRMSTQKSALNA